MDGDTSELTDQWTFAGLESTRRPLVWSKSSIIYTSHPSRPSIEATHFPSKQPVSVPQPSVIQGAPYNYGSPTLLSLSPCDTWIFAYFPGIGVPGVGCLWRRGEEIDLWAEKEWWHFARGDAPIAADWVGGNRQWATDPSGTVKRLPLRGPHLPFPDPMVLLVTQSCRVMFCTYHRQLGTNPNTVIFRLFCCSLLQLDAMTEQPKIMNPDYDPLSSMSLPGGSQIAVMSAIGMQHGEPTIIIAARTCTIPTWSSVPGSVHAMQSETTVSDVTAAFDDVLPSEWGIWGDQDNIQLCEVRFGLTFFGDKQQHPLLLMSTKPLPPILIKESRLTHLTFAPSDMPNSNPTQGLYLITTSVITDGASHATMELASYGVSKNRAEGPSWTVQLLASRLFNHSMLAFLQRIPAGIHSIGASGQTGGSSQLAIGLVVTDQTQLSGEAPAKDRRKHIGNIKILSLPNLEENSRWSLVPMYSAGDSLAPSAAISAALSPNGTLLCTADDMFIGTTIYPIPTYDSSQTPDGMSTHVACALYKSIRARYVPTDLIGFLLSTVSTKDVMDDGLIALLNMSCPSDNEYDGTRWRDVLGMVLEVRRATAALTHSSSVAAVHAIQDICSINAVNMLFEGCSQDDGQYNLDHVWRLISSSAWFASFLEDLARECVDILDAPKSDERMDTSPTGPDDSDLFGSAPPTPAIETSPVAIPVSVRLVQKTESYTPLFHLGHPTLLRNISKLVGHVTRLQKQVSNTPASTLKGHIAKDACRDLFDSLGVNLELLHPIFENMLQDASKADKAASQRSLVMCQLEPKLQDAAFIAGKKLASTDAVDKMRLFLKTATALPDVDMASANIGRHAEDIITKSALGHGTISRCTRCGARTQVTSPMSGELRGLGLWWTPCICAGEWRCNS